MEFKIYKIILIQELLKVSKAIYITVEGMGRNTKIYTSIMDNNHKPEEKVIHLHLSNIRNEKSIQMGAECKVNIRPFNSEYEIISNWFTFLEKLVKKGHLILAGKDIPLLAKRKQELESLQ